MESKTAQLYAPVKLEGGPFGFRDNSGVDLNLGESRYIEIGVNSTERSVFIIVQPTLKSLADQLDYRRIQFFHVLFPTSEPRWVD